VRADRPLRQPSPTQQSFLLSVIDPEATPNQYEPEPELKEKTMKILFINNDGGGYADYIEVAPGTTVDKFFSQQIAGGKSEDYLIRVNRQPVPRDYVLQEGDRVTMTPTKIEGAAAA